MLEVQKFLREHTLEQLQDIYSIEACHHNSLPLVILNYSQTNSPKLVDIVRECRSLILEKDTWNVVSRGFKRFFNLAECVDLHKNFNWNNFLAEEKVDGSYISLYHYNGEWMMSTRGSFGHQLMIDCDFSWFELFWKTLNLTQTQLDNILHTSQCYIFELCSIYNKVVKHHPEPKLYLLDITRRGLDYDKDFGNLEWVKAVVSDYAKLLKVNRPIIYDSFSLSQLNFKDYGDYSFEGFVLRDSNNMRVKLKNPDYVLKHRMANGGVMTNERLYDIIAIGEDDEFLIAYPEYIEKANRIKDVISKFRKDTLDLWKNAKKDGTQKDFALSVVHNKKCAWPCFEAKKYDLTVDKILDDYKNKEKLKKSILDILGD